MNLPEPNVHVDVAAESSGRRLSARVEDVRPPATVVISLPSDGVAAYALSRGEQVELRWLSDRGRILASGPLARRVDVGVPALEIHLQRSEVQQRREDVRAAVDVPVEIEQASAHPLRCRTIDLSGGGMRVRYGAVLALGETVEATIFLPDEDRVDVRASVVRRVADDDYALTFVAIDPPDRERLIRFVFRVLREQP